MLTFTRWGGAGGGAGDAVAGAAGAGAADGLGEGAGGCARPATGANETARKARVARVLLVTSP